MQDVHVRAKQGIKLLVGRQVLLQILTFGGGVILARVLDPAEFGLYAIATFLVGAFALFGDFGLAPSFIQRKEELTELDLRVGFTLQQILITVIVAVLFIAAPWLASLYPKAPPETAWLVRGTAFSLYLTSWRSMSALQLERQMRYERLAWIEVIESVSYQAITVALAVWGYGVWSLVGAALGRGFIGAILVYTLMPWRIRFAMDKTIASAILRFGIPFQIQSFANQAGAWITPALVGSLIGPQAVGFLTWASSNGKKPLILVDSVMRIAFPHFARLQHDRAEVERTLIRYLTVLLLPSGLWFALLSVSGSSLVKWVYTDKWLPAVPALVLSAAVLVFDVLSWVVAMALNGVGLTGFTTRVVALRTVLFLLIGVPFVFAAGFNGVPLAYLIASAFTVPWLVGGLGRGAFIRVLTPLFWIVIPVIVSIGLGKFLAHLLLLPLMFHAVLLTGATAAVFVTAALASAPPWLTKRAWSWIGKYTTLRRLSFAGGEQARR